MKQTLSFSSIQSNISLVENFIDTICKLYGINEDLYGNILISTLEAVNNAITYGNKNNPHKQVTTEAIFENKTLKISITDKGEGFDFNNIPDPTLSENIEKTSGRGIFLIKNLADNLEFQNNGSRLILTFIL